MEAEAAAAAAEAEAAAAAVPPVPTAKGKAGKASKAQGALSGEIIPAADRMTIVVEENDNIPPTGIFIGVNGRSFLIRPGENVDVPIEVVEALNDAVESTPKTDAQGNVVDYRNRLRFPYRIVSK
jgi:hypothetical protein